MRGSTAGIDDSLKGTSEAHFLFLTILDTVLSSLIITPAVVGYWRGTWLLMDIYLFPDNVEVSYLISFLLGLVGNFVFTIGQNVFKNNFHPEKHRLIYYLFSRFYSYVFGLACVNLWRGAWNSLDYYTDQKDLTTVVAPTIVSLVALLGMRTMRNVSASPFAVVLDLSTAYFEVPTMFKLAGTSETSLYVLDCFFSVFVIGSLVVFVWRGLWCLTDLFLYPEDEALSSLGSLVIGYGIVILTFSLQAPMTKICEKLEGFWKLVVVDIYIFFSFLGTINLWRGIWNLLNIYFLPETPALSCWITHLGCFVLLVLISCSNSILVRGVYIDAEEEDGKCVVFPTYYLRMFFQEKRKKKILKHQKSQRISSLVNKADYDRSEKYSSAISTISSNHHDGLKSHVTVDLP